MNPYPLEAVKLEAVNYHFESKPMKDLVDDVHYLKELNLDSLLFRARNLIFRSKNDYVVLEELDKIVQENDYLIDKRKDAIPRNTILYRTYCEQIKKLETLKTIVDAKKSYLQQSIEKRIFAKDKTAYPDYWLSRQILPQLDYLAKKVEELQSHFPSDYNFIRHLNQIKIKNHHQQEIIDLLKGNYNQDWMQRLQSASEKLEETFGTLVNKNYGRSEQSQKRSDYVKDNKRFLKELLAVLKTATSTGYLAERFMNSCLQDMLDDLIELIERKIE